MESIMKYLSDPGVWVSGILFSLIATFIYKTFSRLPGRIVEGQVYILHKSEKCRRAALRIVTTTGKVFPSRMTSPKRGNGPRLSRLC
jgi:hypothetical protein